MVVDDANFETVIKSNSQGGKGTKIDVYLPYREAIFILYLYCTFRSNEYISAC